MSNIEISNKKRSDEYYTPKRVFDALQVEFDMDVAAPVDRTYVCVPAKEFITANSLDIRWNGFVWMNPPYSKNKSLWLNKLFNHGNGIALMPDRTSAPWWPIAAEQADIILLVTGKIKYINAEGVEKKQPGNGSTLFGYGPKAVEAILRAEQNKLGIAFSRRLIRVRPIFSYILTARIYRGITDAWYKFDAQNPVFVDEDEGEEIIIEGSQGVKSMKELSNEYLSHLERKANG